jgi:hypothetical protein
MPFQTMCFKQRRFMQCHRPQILPVTHVTVYIHRAEGTQCSDYNIGSRKKLTNEKTLDGPRLTKWEKVFISLIAETSRNAGLPDFSWYMIPKPEKCTKQTQNVLNGHKISQISLNIPYCHKIYQHFPILGPPKFTLIGIFILKTNHLATL